MDDRHRFMILWNPACAGVTVAGEIKSYVPLIPNAGIDKLYEGLKKPSLQRFGETDDREQELI
ncbi:hypothetical protein [Nisaea sp.]|uniref:hypothetical protein n=1 Tax=Nisaea sp. TaxID=2024842 RepID=UPI00329914C0